MVRDRDVVGNRDVIYNVCVVIWTEPPKRNINDEQRQQRFTDGSSQIQTMIGAAGMEYVKVSDTYLMCRAGRECHIVGPAW